MSYLNYATAVREGRLAEYEAQRVVARGAFEERRATRVENLKRELVRDNLLDPRKLDNVPYYNTIEEQNLFLDSITNGQTFGRSEYNYWTELEHPMFLGQTLKRIQHRFTKEMGIPLILPKFSNLNNISVKEQQFLAMQGIEMNKDEYGRYGAGMLQGARVFQHIEESGGKIGAYYRFVEPSEYYISIGLVSPELLREVEVHGAVSGTGFKRGRGYVGDEPEVTTSQVEPQVVVEKPFEKPDYRGTQPEPEITTAHIEPQVVVEKPFDKPDYRGTQPEPEITTDHIQPPSEEQDFLPPTSQVDPPIVEPEPQVTTSQVDPPGVEEPEVTTSQVEPQEVTAQMSWFGDTWFPWHLSFDKRRR